MLPFLAAAHLMPTRVFLGVRRSWRCWPGWRRHKPAGGCWRGRWVSLPHNPLNGGYLGRGAPLPPRFGGSQPGLGLSQLEEAARNWGREKQELGTRLLEREHGFPHGPATVSARGAQGHPALGGLRTHLHTRGICFSFPAGPWVRRRGVGGP